MVRTPGFPKAQDEWARELRRFRPVDAARRFAPRPMLVLHGEDDDSVPPIVARQPAAAHGAAELRIIPGAGHRLRHDPRAIAAPSSAGWTASAAEPGRARQVAKPCGCSLCQRQAESMI